MAQKPILFLDVDGVLNCFDEANGTLIHEGSPERACVPWQMSDKLKVLNDRFDIVWATAWFGSANAAFKEFLPIKEAYPFLQWRQHKLTEILKYANGRPWAWADDDIQFELDDLGWDRDRMIPDNAFLLDVAPNVGLGWKDVTALVMFAEDNTPVEPDETEFIA